MNSFAISGSDHWGCDDFTDSLHDQIFGKSDSRFDVNATKRKKLKRKRKAHRSSELDNGAVRDTSHTREKNCVSEVTEPVCGETSPPKSFGKKKAKKIKHLSRTSTSEVKNNGKQHVNKLEPPQSKQTRPMGILPVNTKSKKIAIDKKSSADLREPIAVNELAISEFHKKSKRRKGKRKNVEDALDSIPNKRKNLKEELCVSDSKTKASGTIKVKHLNPSKLLQVFKKYSAHAEVEVKKGDSPQSRSSLLKENATRNLQAARFRFLNEKMYTATGSEALQYFKNDPGAFGEYHQGYQSQVMKWPINPVDLIINDLQKTPKSLVIADLGCGDAKIASTFPKRTVHSFDLVALNDNVVCCDVSKLPLRNESVDIAVFCLSLMGVNLTDYILESHRILKVGGLLKIAEVESRIDDLNLFITNMEKYGFSLISKDTKQKMFVFMDFHKVQRKLKKNKLPTIEMSPCMYKKR